MTVRICPRVPKICLRSIMDNTLVYEAGDCGSIPYGGAKLMEGCPAGDAGTVLNTVGGLTAQGFDYAILPPI